MIFKDKVIKLKSNKEVILRSQKVSDAQNLLNYLKEVSRETDFMVRYPEEITMSLEGEEKIIENIINSDKDIMISAFIDEKLVGNLGLNCFRNHIKLKHRAVIGIAIRKDYWNLGLGSILIEEAINLAIELGYEQIELEVSTLNERAIVLYKKYGFEVYGIRDRDFKFKDGSYGSSTLMMKKLK